MTTRLVEQEHRYLYFNGRNGFCDECWQQRRSKFKRLVPYVNVMTNVFEWGWKGLCGTHAKSRAEPGLPFGILSWGDLYRMAGVTSDEMDAIIKLVYPI